MRKILYFVFALSVFSLFSATVLATETARDITAECEISGLAGGNATDGNLSTYTEIQDGKFTVKSAEKIGGVYVRFRSVPTLKNADGETEKGILAQYEDISESDITEASFEYEQAEICEINVYSKGEIPQSVQRWRLDNSDTDILLLATHSDDDQLFFAGLLPYYAVKDGVRVRVAYFVSHNDAPSRLHELLSGLWECRVEYYPEIGIFPDAWSENLEWAVENLNSAEFIYDDVKEYQRYLLEKYHPKVVVLHDFNGEYSHGQHILNTKSFCDELENTAEGQYIPEKVYVHLYGENVVKLPIDEPLSEFDGLSAFNVSQNAFRHHKSQHWTWFYKWIYGKNGQIKSSAEINSYNPALYGLYFTRVGGDSGKNDILENVTPYFKAEELERQKALKEEQLQQQRQEAERLEREELQKKQQAEAFKEAERQKREKTLIFILSAVTVLVAAAFTVIAVKRIKK